MRSAIDYFNHETRNWFSEMAHTYFIIFFEGNFISSALNDQKL